LWGSGIGSIPVFNKPYLSFVNNFLEEHSDIQTIVDIGCGDWQIGQQLHIQGREYIGTDVSDYIVAKNKKRFKNDNVTFMHLDAVTEPLPEGDLATLKDVIQHLPTEGAQKVLENLDAYKYVVMQNDIYEDQRGNWDIQSGQFRPLDVTKEPFNKTEYKLVKVYTEGLRKSLNVVRKIFSISPIRKGIYVKFGRQVSSQ
jgi:SAM-dependent methyltransferase